MKKYISIILAVAALSCSRNWNDLVHEEVVAEITEFGVEGQVSSVINKLERTATVEMPSGSDLGNLAVSAFACTEGALKSFDLQAGDVLDLNEPMTIVLTTYDEYTWTLRAVISEDEPAEPEKKLTRDGPQIYNMGFDLWSKHPDNKNVDVIYGDDATEEQKAVWVAGGGELIAALGFPTVVPESEFLAVPGEGRKALRLETKVVLNKLASGSAFTGSMAGIDIWSMSAKLNWGIPFTARPAALEGYACYKPKTINKVQDPYSALEGSLDNGHIFVLLTDWDKPFLVSPPNSLVDFDGDPNIIGYGKVVFDKEMEGYERFQIDIDYRNDRTPKYLTVVLASSAYGDYFTGAEGSVLYADELAFLYGEE